MQSMEYAISLKQLFYNSISYDFILPYLFSLFIDFHYRLCLSICNNQYWYKRLKTKAGNTGVLQHSCSENVCKPHRGGATTMVTFLKRNTIPGVLVLLYELFQNTLFKQHPRATVFVSYLNHRFELHYHQNVMLSLYTLENQLIIDIPWFPPPRQFFFLNLWEDKPLWVELKL